VTVAWAISVLAAVGQELLYRRGGRAFPACWLRAIQAATSVRAVKPNLVKMFSTWFRGALGNNQVGRDFLVGLADGDEADDLAFSFGECPARGSA
jgi:hypothetical protein